MEPIKQSGHWVSAEEALEDVNLFCKTSSIVPFKSLDCFKVYGRGRDRPKISEIILPKEHTEFNQSVGEVPRVGRGRGKLLLMESDDDSSDPGTASKVVRSTTDLTKQPPNSSLKYLEDNFSRDNYSFE